MKFLTSKEWQAMVYRLLFALLVVFVAQSFGMITSYSFGAISKSLFSEMNAVALYGGMGLGTLSFVGHAVGGHNLEGWGNKALNIGMVLGGVAAVGSLLTNNGFVSSAVI